MEREAFWFMLSFALGIIWSFIIVYFLSRVMAGGVYVLIFFVIIPFCFLFYDDLIKRKKTIQITFLVVLIGSGIFLGGVHVGLVESMSLAEDSLIDISNGVIAIHVRNTGLSDIKITEVTVGGITFNMSHYIRYFSLNLAIGTDAYLIIHYVKRAFIWSKKPLSLKKMLSWEPKTELEQGIREVRWLG